MAIFRGEGGSGESTNNTVANEIELARVAARDSATAAALSATQSANSATAANTSRNFAVDAQQAAQGFAGNADASATAAAVSAAAALVSENNAAQSAVDASNTVATIDLPTIVRTDTVQTVTGAKTFTQNIVASGGVTGNVTGDVTGNAGTVTNGVYANQSYADPSWITSIATSKLTGIIDGGTY